MRVITKPTDILIRIIRRISVRVGDIPPSVVAVFVRHISRSIRHRDRASQRVEMIQLDILTIVFGDKRSIWLAYILHPAFAYQQLFQDGRNRSGWIIHELIFIAADGKLTRLESASQQLVNVLLF